MPDDEKIRHLSRSVDYIENRITKLNSDCRIFIAWQFLTIGLTASLFGELYKRKQHIDFLDIDETIFIYLVTTVFIMVSIVNIIMYINCIRPVKQFPHNFGYREIFGSLFALDVIKFKDTSRTNLIWPLSDTPMPATSYMEQFAIKLSGWKTESEEKELAMTLAVLHRLVSIKMSWYRVAILSTRAQLFFGLIFYGIIISVVLIGWARG